jgi:uncharacterized protein YcbK (DUF882 family)
MRAAALAAAVLLLAAIAALLLWPDAARADDYHAWAVPHRANITAYKKFLQQRKVADVVPMPQLLKSARNWQECHAEPYAIPPQELWPRLVPTLLVVKKMKSAGAFRKPMAASVYRDPVLNDCAGGAKSSRHLQLNAIDFDIEASKTSLKKLCSAWQKLGPKYGIGLGFYTPTRIHIDTSGYRTWGADHSFKTSLCLQAPPA